MPPDVPIAKGDEAGDEPRAIGTAAERHPEPGSRVDPDEALDGVLGGAHVGREAATVEERHARVVEGMAPNQVAVARQLGGQLRIGLRPATLDEERGAHLEPAETLDERGRSVSVIRSIGVLGVKGQRHPEWRAYFSTPLMTMPRVKKRWNAMNRMTGMTRVIRVPAWIRDGLR